MGRAWARADRRGEGGAGEDIVGKGRLGGGGDRCAVDVSGNAGHTYHLDSARYSWSTMSARFGPVWVPEWPYDRHAGWSVCPSGKPTHVP